MKKYNSLPIYILLTLFAFGFAGCKKDQNNTDPPNENEFRMIEQSVIIYDLSQTFSSTFSYVNEKLDVFEYFQDQELFSRSNYSYNANKIYRNDTNFRLDYYDSIMYTSAEMEIENNHIVKASSEGGEYNSLYEYFWSGDKMNKWESYIPSGEPDLKGDYTYEGNNLVTYGNLAYDVDNGWELMQKNEYTYLDGKVHEIYYSYGLIGTELMDPQMKREFIYDGDQIEKVLWYFAETDSTWAYYMQSDFTYNSDGLLVEVYEYQEANGMENPYYRFTYTYEPGKGNKQLFDEVYLSVPVLERGFTFWGLFSASSKKNVANPLTEEFIRCQ